MSTRTRLAAAAAVVVVAGFFLTDDAQVATAPGAAGAGATASPAPAVAAPTETTAPPPAGAPDGTPLLLPAEHGDGDSWRDTTGREYRLGLINTPEVGECFAAEATAERRALVASGFRADVYTDDRYGRGVSVVTTADGRDVNVHLARYGFADDRYLDRFRHENPELAGRLDAAFAAARAERRGLWGSCPGAGDAPAAAPVAAAAPGSASCHPDYATCVPVQGDGSGRGGGNDLDCGGLTGAVQVRQPGVDPYRLDADGDGTGCD